MQDIETFYIIPRREWNAHPPRSVFGLARPARQILATWTNSEHCHDRTTCLKAIKDLQVDHMDKGMEDIAYNFVIGGDGMVYEGRGWNVVAMAIEDYETIQHTSILVGCIGIEEMVPTKEKINTVENLISFGKRKGFLNESTCFLPMFDITQQSPKIGK